MLLQSNKRSWREQHTFKTLNNSFEAFILFTPETKIVSRPSISYVRKLWREYSWLVFQTYLIDVYAYLSYFVISLFMQFFFSNFSVLFNQIWLQSIYFCVHHWYVNKKILDNLTRIFDNLTLSYFRIKFWIFFEVLTHPRCRCPVTPYSSW